MIFSFKQNLVKNPKKIPLRKALLVHYSCESFYETEQNNSPKISSICVHDFETYRAV